MKCQSLISPSPEKGGGGVSTSDGFSFVKKGGGTLLGTLRGGRFLLGRPPIRTPGRTNKKGEMGKVGIAERRERGLKSDALPRKIPDRERRENIRRPLAEKEGGRKAIAFQEKEKKRQPRRGKLHCVWGGGGCGVVVVGKLMSKDYPPLDRSELSRVRSRVDDLGPEKGEKSLPTKQRRKKT